MKHYNINLNGRPEALCKAWEETWLASKSSGWATCENDYSVDMCLVGTKEVNCENCTPLLMLLFEDSSRREQ